MGTDGAGASGTGAARSAGHAAAASGADTQDSASRADVNAAPPSSVPTEIEESLLLGADGTVIESDQSDMMLEDDGNFAKLLESMTLRATQSTLDQQRRYATSLQGDPLYASGSIVIDDLQCGQKVCAFAISSAEPRDLDAFIERLSQRKTAPVYALSSVELTNTPAHRRVRRVLISIDPRLAGISLPQGASLPTARHARP